MIIPTRWAMDGLDGMTWRGLGFSLAFTPIAVLLFFPLLFGVVEVMRFPWRTGGYQEVPIHSAEVRGNAARQSGNVIPLFCK
jgi:hypothetical protein